MAAFQEYIDERAGSGVVIAKAVTDVSFTDCVVRVTFDPAAAGIERATFDTAASTFDSLAEFVGTPIAFNDDPGNWPRPAIDAVETVLADGTPLGTMTAAETYKMGTGKDLQKVSDRAHRDTSKTRNHERRTMKVTQITVGISSRAHGAGRRQIACLERKGWTDLASRSGTLGRSWPEEHYIVKTSSRDRARGVPLPHVPAGWTTVGPQVPKVP